MFLTIYVLLLNLKLFSLKSLPPLLLAKYPHHVPYLSLALDLNPVTRTFECHDVKQTTL